MEADLKIILVINKIDKKDSRPKEILNNGENVRLKYKISDNNLLRIRSVLLTKTRGKVIMSTYFLRYFPKGKK